MRTLLLTVFALFTTGSLFVVANTTQKVSRAKHSFEFVKNHYSSGFFIFISLISLYVSSPAQLFRALLASQEPLAFQELPAYQAITVVTVQKENEERLVRREKLVPRPFQTGNNVFGKGVMTAILE